MRPRTALIPLALALLVGCGSSPSKPAEGAEGEKTDSPPAGGHEGDATPAAEASAAPTMGAVKREGAATDVPDDYSLTDNDCQALARQYGDAARGDQRAGISAKLPEKQRQQAEASIDGVVAKLESQWAETCQKSLVGHIVEHKNIKCALASKSVKAFDVCLNGDKGEKSDKKK